MLEELDPDGPALFQTLRDDEELTRLRDAIAAAIPNTEAIAAAGEKSAQAWAPEHEQIAAALRRAEQLVGLGAAGGCNKPVAGLKQSQCNLERPTAKEEPE